jgi:hypothetical protein
MEMCYVIFMQDGARLPQFCKVESPPLPKLMDACARRTGSFCVKDSLARDQDVGLCSLTPLLTDELVNRGPSLLESPHYVDDPPLRDAWHSC